MTSSVDQQMTEIYCFVDDFLRAHPALARWRWSPHAQPQFSDAEVLTIALLQGVFAVATLNQTYRLMAQNWRAAFPHLPSSKQGLARAHHLLPHGGGLLAATCTHLCHSLRHGRVRLLREEGAYFGKTSKGQCFGFKLHLLRHGSGRVMTLILTPGNWDDRELALALVQG